MATNYVQPGAVLTMTTPTGGVTSNDGVLVGSLFGIATTDAAAGDPVELALTGVWDLPKVSAQAWTEGARIYWDNTAKNCTTTATSNTLIGVAAAAAANPSATGRVRLNGSF